MKKKFTKGFGIRLKRLIDNSRYNQGQVAIEVNVSKSTITGYINEDFLPGSDVLAKMVKLFSTTSDYLLFGITPVAPELAQFEKIIKKAKANISVVKDEGNAYNTLSAGEKKVVNLIRENPEVLEKCLKHLKSYNKGDNFYLSWMVGITDALSKDELQTAIAHYVAILATK